MRLKNLLREAETTLILIRHDISNNGNTDMILRLQSQFDNIKEKCTIHFRTRTFRVCNLYMYVLGEINGLLNNGFYDQAYDLVDAFHCLPSILLSHQYSIPDQFWIVYVLPYANKWDESFSQKAKNSLTAS